MEYSYNGAPDLETIDRPSSRPSATQCQVTIFVSLLTNLEQGNPTTKNKQTGKVETRVSNRRVAGQHRMARPAANKTTESDPKQEEYRSVATSAPIQILACVLCVLLTREGTIYAN